MASDTQSKSSLHLQITLNERLTERVMMFGLGFMVSLLPFMVMNNDEVGIRENSGHQPTEQGQAITLPQEVGYTPTSRQCLEPELQVVK